MPGNIINLKPEDILAWPEPNYINPETRDWMPAYAGTLYAFATICLGMRLLSRFRNNAGGFGWDDALLTLGWMFLTWFTALAIVAAEKYMTKRHIWDIPLKMFEGTALITWIAELAFLLVGCTVKVSVLLFYRRLVEGTCSKPWLWAVWLAIAFTCAWSLAMILALVFNCNPTEAYWKSFSLTWTGKYHCVKTTVNNLLAGILAVVSDLYAVALPCVMMRRLQLPRSQKMGLYAVFSLGLVVVAASSVRTYYLWNVGHQSDVSTYIFNVFVWSQLELTLGVACASAPSMRVFFRRLMAGPLSKLKDYTSSSSRSYQKGSLPRARDSDVELVEQASPEAKRKRSYYSVQDKSIMTATTDDEGTIVASEPPTSPTKWNRHDRKHTLDDVEAIDIGEMLRSRRAEMTPTPAGDWPTTPVGEVEPNIIRDKQNASWLESQ